MVAAAALVVAAAVVVMTAAAPALVAAAAAGEFHALLAVGNRDPWRPCRYSQQAAAPMAAAAAAATTVMMVVAAAVAELHALPAGCMQLYGDLLRLRRCSLRVHGWRLLLRRRLAFLGENCSRRRLVGHRLLLLP